MIKRILKYILFILIAVLILLPYNRVLKRVINTNLQKYGYKSNIKSVNISFDNIVLKDIRLVKGKNKISIADIKIDYGNIISLMLLRKDINVILNNIQISLDQKYIHLNADFKINELNRNLINVSTVIPRNNFKGLYLLNRDVQLPKFIDITINAVITKNEINVKTLDIKGVDSLSLQGKYNIKKQNIDMKINYDISVDYYDYLNKQFFIQAIGINRSFNGKLKGKVPFIKLVK